MGDLATLVTNTEGIITPITLMVYAICYLAGLIFGIGALINAAKVAQGRGNSQTGYAGPVWSFAIGAILLAAPAALDAGTQSIFGISAAQSPFSYNPPAASSLTAEGRRMVQVILAWCQLFGLIAFIKGLMMVRATANGLEPRTYGPGITFIVGGVLATNIVLVINAVATTLGVSNYVSG